MNLALPLVVSMRKCLMQQDPTISLHVQLTLEIVGLFPLSLLLIV